MKATDLKNEYPNILIYGSAGTGKTALVSQASRGYMLDFDGGMMTAKTLVDSFSGARKSMEFDTFVDENPEKPRAWMAARKKLQSIVKECQAGTWKYDALVIDSLTGLIKAATLHVMSCVGDIFMKPRIQDYGSIVQEAEIALTMMRAVKTLRLTTAHELVVEKIEEKKITPTVDYITPMSATRRHSIGKLMWLFDEVWYATIQRGAANKIDFVIDAKPATSHKCRTRSNLPGNVVHNEIGLVGLLEKVGYKYEMNKGEDKK